MWLDLLALGILLAAAVLGLGRGLAVSTVRLAGALSAYLGSWWLGPAAAPFFETHGLSGMLAVAAGGLGVFFGLLLSVEILAALVKSHEARRRGRRPRSTPDRVGGALVGALAGAGFAVLVAWLGITVDALRIQTGNTALPSIESSRFAPVARGVIRGVGGWLLAGHGSPGAALAHAASDPAETLQAVQRLLENPRLVALKDDRTFWQQVESGRSRAAVERVSFLALAYDGRTREHLAALGLIREPAARSSRAFRDASAQALAAAGPRLRAIREDPALGRLAADPAVQEMVRRNDTLGLLRNPDVRRVIAHALAGPSA